MWRKRDKLNKNCTKYHDVMFCMRPRVSFSTCLVGSAASAWQSGQYCISLGEIQIQIQIQIQNQKCKNHQHMPDISIHIEMKIQKYRYLHLADNIESTWVRRRKLERQRHSSIWNIQVYVHKIQIQKLQTILSWGLCSIVRNLWLR